MIWGHDPPRTHEKITGKTGSFRAFCFLFFRFARKEEKMNTFIKEETLGQRIRAQRIRLGMTQEELAEEMNTTKSMISYYENDHGDMKQSMIAEFAKILGTTVEYLVCGVIKESSPDASSAEMLQLFSSMDEQTKEIMLIQMRALAKRGH
jgi:transcriptional regulator with XRE-family HTH domain